MKKQIHILQGMMILTIISIFSLLGVKFIYGITHEEVDTSYMWNIDFNNIRVSEGSQKGDLSLDNNKINLNLTLSKDNTYYEFYVDIINSGTLNAKLIKKDFDIKIDNNFLKYTITYDNGEEINIGDSLSKKETKTIKVRIEYPKQDKIVYQKLNMTLSLSLVYGA